MTHLNATYDPDNDLNSFKDSDLFKYGFTICRSRESRKRY